MENQDTTNIYNLYREAYDFNYKPGFHDFGPEINEFMKRLSEDEKISLIEGHFRHAFKEGRESLDGVLYDKLKELDDINKLSVEELQAGLDYWHEENAEEGVGTMRGYMEDQLVSTFEGDGVMDLEEFISLGEEYLSALYGGPHIDAGDMDLEEFVSMVGEEIGMDFEIHGNKVMLADYRN